MKPWLCGEKSWPPLCQKHAKSAVSPTANALAVTSTSFINSPGPRTVSGEVLIFGLVSWLIFKLLSAATDILENAVLNC